MSSRDLADRGRGTELRTSGIGSDEPAFGLGHGELADRKIQSNRYPILKVAHPRVPNQY